MSEAAIGVGPLAVGMTLIVGNSRDAVTKLGRQEMVTADEVLEAGTPSIIFTG